MKTKKYTASKAAFFSLYDALQDMSNKVGQPAFAYAVVVNRRRLEPVIEAIEAARDAVPEQAKDFAKKLGDLNARNVMRGDDGRPVPHPSGRGYLIPRTSVYEAELAAMQAADPDGVRMTKEHEESFAKMLEENAGEVELATCKLSDMPPLSGTQMEALMPMIDDA